MHVSIRLQELGCHDEADGDGNAEPYLWCCFFKVDHSVLQHFILELDRENQMRAIDDQLNLGFLPNLLDKTAAPLQDHEWMHWSNGRHGNLGSEMDSGQARRIPEELGLWSTELKTGNTTTFSDVRSIGAVAVLLEEDDTPPDHMMDELYATFVNQVREKLRLQIRSALLKLADVTQTSSEGSASTLTPEAELLQSLKDALDEPSNIFYTLANRDDVIGTLFQTYTVQALEQGPQFFGRTWSPATGSEDGTFSLHGFAASDDKPMSAVMWTQPDQRISLWRVNARGYQVGWTEHGPFGNWFPINVSSGYALWRHMGSQISLWCLNPNGTQRTFQEHGPHPEWLPVHVCEGHILWYNVSGKISLWKVDSEGRYLSHVEHGPYGGWSVVNFTPGRLLWRHTTGSISLWKLGPQNEHVTYREHGPIPGWNVVACSGDKLLWRHDNGAISLWRMNSEGDKVDGVAYGPFTGWTAIGFEGHHILWQHENGAITIWLISDELRLMSDPSHGPHPGWTPKTIGRW